MLFSAHPPIPLLTLLLLKLHHPSERNLPDLLKPFIQRGLFEPFLECGQRDLWDVGSDGRGVEPVEVVVFLQRRVRGEEKTARWGRTSLAGWE